MTERKNKRASENAVEVDSEDMTFILEPARVEVGSGYTVAISYDENKKQIVDVKTYGEVDITQLRRDIARIFPYAQIRKLDRSCSVTLVKAKKKHTKRKKKDKHRPEFCNEKRD